MTPMSILGRSFRSIAGNLVEAIQISGLIWIALLALQILIGTLSAPAGEGPLRLPIFLNAVFAVIGGVWISVAWHRFLVKGERPTGVLPAWSGPSFWSYLRRTFLVGLMLTGILFALVMVFSLAGAGVTPDGQIAGPAGIISFIGGMILNFVFLRLGPVFPAAAIGEPMTFSQAWSRTKQIAPSCAVLALLSSVLMPVYVSIQVSMGPGSLAGLFVELILGWMILMFSVSLLTTIYAVTAPDDAAHG